MPKIEMNMPELPEGFEYTSGTSSHWYINHDNDTVQLLAFVRRVPIWRPAKIEDIDKGLRARFWDDRGLAKYENNYLAGWRLGKWLSVSSTWDNCEVLDS